MKKAIIQKSWGEIGLGSKKKDGWAWEVTLMENGVVYDRRTFDYYTQQGNQGALDYARAWDENFTVQVGDLG